MVVRHRQLALDYRTAISYPLGFLHSAGLEAYTPPELMMRYGLKTGNRFLLMKDEVTDVLYTLAPRCPGWPDLRNFIRDNGVSGKRRDLKNGKGLSEFLQELYLNKFS